ncbi:hypothetical protein DBV15_08872 [Temnothorax longispinosus]|uniref:Uncharacterized protein n=1 Tax=Temnothorax longispinosus TaxID=300112 RepID=A0A4V3SBD3_9HYME|nr:hypothetical protein DBV15_08872 [Temnothorax longispinosus]
MVAGTVVRGRYGAIKWLATAVSDVSARCLALLSLVQVRLSTVDIASYNIASHIESHKGYFNLDCLFSSSSPSLISSFPFGLPYVEVYPVTHQSRENPPNDLGSIDTIHRPTTNDLFRGVATTSHHQQRKDYHNGRELKRVIFRIANSPSNETGSRFIAAASPV